MDLMTLHPKASEDSSGDLLRTLEPKDATEEEFYYHATDMPTEMVSGDGALDVLCVLVTYCVCVGRVYRGEVLLPRQR
jgi:hypothetical protein